MLSRSFHPVIVLVMIASLVVGTFAPLHVSRALAQDDAATPPIIQPVEEIEPEPEDPIDDGPVSSLEIAVSGDLGDGGQPDGFPREVTIGDERFLFDRLVPVATDGLAQIAADESLTVYAIAAEGPFNSLYIAAAGQAEGTTARYLPERIATPDVACLAEAADLGQLTAGDSVYVFAGLETDLTIETLESVGTSGENQLFADIGAAQPYPELFIADPAGLLRFVLASGDGRPDSLSESLAFDATEYSFTADATDQIDPASLSKAGCAGPFPVFAGPDAAASLYVRAGGRLFEFSGEAAPADVPTEAPAEASPGVVETPDDASPEVPVEPAEASPGIAAEDPTQSAFEFPVGATEVSTEEPSAVPTEDPTEAPTEAPTEEPATEAPTEAPATEAPASEAPATEAPATEAPATEAPATEAPAEESTEAAIEDVQAAEEAGLPEQVEVQNTTYIFNQVAVDIDIETLVQVEVVTVNNVEVTIYAQQEISGVVLELYAVVEGGEAVGRYVPAASAMPSPPAELPPVIEVQNSTYVFNEVKVEINIQTLVEVEVITVQNTELTIYVDQDVQGEVTRYYAAALDGQVVGVYVEASLVASAQQAPPPTAQLQPPAFVPTPASDAPPPAAVTAEASTTCSGNPGEIDAQGLPARLPARIQLGGIAYSFTATADHGEIGELTLIGCVGPFEVVSTDQADQSEVLILRYTGAGPASDVAYRFEVAVTFGVEFEITGRAQVISTGEQEYRLVQTWQRSLYSSTTVILFVQDPENAAPETFYAVNVGNSPSGDAIGEYQLGGENDQASEEMAAAAEQAGLNPDLTVEGQRYLLVSVFLPVGTTTNGFVTIFATSVDGETTVLFGRDIRRLELLIYEVIPSEQGD